MTISTTWVAATTVALGLALASVPATAGATDTTGGTSGGTTTGTADPAPKVTRTFTRLTWRDDNAGWWASEAVRVSPDGGRRSVRYQVRKNGTWVTCTWQTTLSTGRFDFGARDLRKYRTRQNKDLRVPDRFYSRVVVPGDATHERLVSPTWLTSFG